MPTTERTAHPAAHGDRSVADGAHVDCAEQHSDPRLRGRRDDGPAVVRRRRLSAAHGRAAVAGDRPDAERRAGLDARPRRDAAVDAGRAQRRDVWGAAEGLRRRRHPGVRAASRRRHRVVHAVPRHRAVAGARRGDRCRRRPRSWSTTASATARRPRASAIGSTRAIRARRACSRWRSSSSSKASTSA